MTDAELCAFIAETRATIDAELVRLESLDWDAMPPDVHAEMAALRQGYLDLCASLTDEAIAAELAATEYAGRDLMPAEVRALLVKQ